MSNYDSFSSVTCREIAIIFMHVAFKLIVPSGEDELKQDVVVSCIKALHKIHYIEKMFGCLIFFFFT